jgi:hypothetical protein
VAAETEKASCGNSFNKKWVIEVFPAPEGAVMIMILLLG